MADNKHDQAATLTRRSAMQAGAGAALASGVPLFWSREARADKAKVDAVLGGAVSSGNVPGVVAVAADDKGVIYEGAFGKRNLVTGTAMTPDTMFWIASMTKAVTSTAAMQMVEQGKLSLDKPISDVVLELSAAQVLEGFDASGAPKLRPPKRPMKNWQMRLPRFQICRCPRPKCQTESTSTAMCSVTSSARHGPTASRRKHMTISVTS